MVFQKASTQEKEFKNLVHENIKKCIISTYVHMSDREMPKIYKQKMLKKYVGYFLSKAAIFLL